MALWRDGAFAEDTYAFVADDVGIPADRDVLISLPRWLLEKEALAARNAAVGVEVAAGKDTLDQLGKVAERPLVALRFEKFSDGRAFSYAILLRERHGFTGELRARGDVLLDEIPLMLRCGFTSFEVVNAPTLRALSEGRLPRLTQAYQPSFNKSEGRAGERPWLRRLAC